MLDQSHTPAEINIHLRAKAQDKALIDQAANLSGTNRSQFMLGASLAAAKKILLEQTTFHADNAAFHKIMDWLDAPASDVEEAGIVRLKQTKTPW